MKESTYIRKVVLVYFLIAIIIALISEIPYFKENTALGFQFWLMILNALLFLWFIVKLMKSDVKLQEIICDFKTKVKWSEIIKIISTNIVLSVGFIFCLSFIVYKINPQLLNKLLSESSTESNTLNSVIFNFIGAVLLAPIVEEFIFRGVILNRLKMRWKVGTSIILSSLMFGLIHAEMAFFGAFVFGIIMSMLYFKTKNILVTVSAHFLNNLIVSFVNIILFFYDSSSSSNGFNGNEICIMGSIGLIMLVISGFFTVRYIKKGYVLRDC